MYLCGDCKSDVTKCACVFERPCLSAYLYVWEKSYPINIFFDSKKNWN